MSSHDIHQQTVLSNQNNNGSSGGGAPPSHHQPTSSGAGGAAASSSNNASSGLLGSRQPPRNSEESLLLALVTKCPAEWQVLAEFLRMATPIMQKHPAYDARLGALGFLERHNTYFQLADGKIRVRPFYCAPNSLDVWDATTSAHPHIIAKVLAALPTSPSVSPSPAGDNQPSVETGTLQALLTEDEKLTVRQSSKSFARFLRMHGKLLVVSSDNTRVRHFVPDNEPCADHVAARRLEADSLNPNDPVLQIPATMNDNAMSYEDAVYSVRELYDALPLVQAVVLKDLLALVPNVIRQSLPSTVEEMRALMLRYPEYFACWAYPDDPTQLVVQRAKLVTSDISKEDLVRAVLPLIPQGGLDAEKLMRRVPLPVQRYFYKYGLERMLKEHMADYVLVVNHKVLKTC
ncbi:Hypothetical protein, putative [Bodo saltans]|uniref:Uncharacterized protein n=1 Tax=Bodo saltans TaxID=75058 RepID=A0A0S4JS39_BODSA|nr:Hypothetical protein, putative [Bodo saltans]|eukprot:CUG94335.1 Hypothetical protein, putative [Bodo saltans]